MDRKERLKNENSLAPLNHNVRHIKRIKEGNIITTVSSQWMWGTLVVGRRQKECHYKPLL